VVGATAGRIDPALLYDVSAAEPESGQLSFRELLVGPEHETHDHVHADSVTVRSDGCVDPGAVLDVLEEPPAGAYRMKGTVAVRYRSSTRRYVVNVVGATIHVAPAPPDAPANSLVAIGMGLDADAARARLQQALAPVSGAAASDGIRRLQRYRRLSV
jgi:G3E family GTPase